MIKRKLLLCIAIFFWVEVVTNAQSLRGRVIDDKGNPVEIATIYLSADKTTTGLISSCISDSLGYFILDWHNHSVGYLNVSHIEYNSYQEKIELKQQAECVEVTLLPRAIHLREVKVVGDRSSVISTKNGAKIYRLSSNASKMKNIYSSLQEIPDLIVNVAEQKIDLVGGGQALILINGVYTGQDLMALSSADIDKVEIKNTIPQEYRHLGYSCMVNIHTKTVKEKNYTTNLGVYTHPKIIFGIADFSATLETNKYTLLGTVKGFGFLDNKSNVSENAQGELYNFTQNSQRVSDYKNLSIAAGGHIKWNKDATTSIGLIYSTKPQQYKSENHIDILSTGNQLYSYDYSRSYSDCLNGYTVNVYHSHLIKHFGRFSLYGSFYNGTNKNNTTNTQSNNSINGILVQKQELHSNLREFNAGVKYNKSLWGGNIEIGNSTQGKSSFITRDGKQTSSSQLKNYFYTEYSKQIGKWDILCSLGWDIFVSHFNKGSFTTQTFLPILNMTYKQGGNSLRFLYQKDYFIPSITQLSPINSSYLFTGSLLGNPSLIPETSHTIKLSYEISRKPYYWQVYLKNDLIQDKVFMFTKSSESLSTTISFENAKSLFWVADLGTILRLKYRGAMLNIQGGYRMTAFSNRREYNLFGGMQLNYSWKKLYASLSLSLPYIARSIETYQKSSPESQMNITYAINNMFDINLGVRYVFSKKSFEKTESLDNYSYHYLNEFSNRGNIILLGFRIKFSSKTSGTRLDTNIIKEQERNRILSD